MPLPAGYKWTIGLSLGFAFFAFSLLLAPQPPQAQTVNYAICEGIHQDLDFSKSTDNYFDVQLNPSCFSDLIMIPSWWQNWNSTNQDANTWIAYWYPGDKQAIGPYPSTQSFAINKPGRAPFRVQGAGRVRFATKENYADYQRSHIQPVQPEEAFPVPPEPATAPRSPVEKMISPATSRIAMADNIRFDLQECSRSGLKIICSGLVSSLSGDCGVAIHGAAWENNRATTRAIDTSGRELRPTLVQIGYAVNQNNADDRLPRGVPTKFFITFLDVPDDTIQFQLLELGGFNHCGNGNFKLQIHNITITR